MVKRARLDAELVRRGLAKSRGHASELVEAGRVLVRGTVASKPATAVEPDTPVIVKADADDPGWASRGAHKLLGALAAFTPEGLTVEGRRCLDAGASTGGFTDVLLRNGAGQVVAADVGRGLLDWRLRTDSRVVVRDKVNVRHLTPDQIDGLVDLVVSDLSFISLKLVLPALAGCVTADADLVLMVKPQFEVGKQRVGSGGVVRNPEYRVDAVVDVIATATELGLGAKGVVARPLPGPSGNVEYFVWFRRGEPLPVAESTELVRIAVAEGPQ